MKLKLIATSILAVAYAIVIILGIYYTARYESKDYYQHRDIYKAILEYRSTITTTNTEAAKMAEMYENHLTNISSRVTWRSSVLLSAILAAVIISLIFILNRYIEKLYIGIIITLFVVTMFIFIILTGVNTMWESHYIRPLSNYVSLFNFNKLD